ncbi:membrane-spanning 4-domains subfamily A member 4A-like [Octodon degus]|uniref:Membrane-spanning 4-domains subfamily A member 4A-like n=1 Tax=Octodon degus TaxID=10160 RepID=A0A6P6DSL3_OCTDE|nr:membrane-spanning 4-domains subfamily A member 4A-like [Octodon degus]
MVTIQGMEQTRAEAGHAMPQLRKAMALESSLWEKMKEKFTKGQPKILGAMQITTGLLILGVGLAMMCSTLPAYGARSLSVYTGYSIWGSLMFIISGSFAIATARRTTKGFVRASLGLNICSSVFAGVGMILIMTSLGISLSFPFPCSYNWHESCLMTRSLILGMDWLLLLLSMLELSLAIAVSSFGCKVTCCYLGGVVFILSSNSHTTETMSPAPLGRGLMSPTNPEKSVAGSIP